jgi:hypothetical protein
MDSTKYMAEAEHMDGVKYTAEPEHMDEDSVESSSPPDSAKRAPARQDTFRPNTYPGGVGPPIFSAGQQRSRDPSISSQGPLSSLQHFNAQTGVFQSSMTESPKPLSPGQSGDRGAPRMHQFPPARRGTSPMTLPTPATTTTGSSSGPSLPSLHFASHQTTHQNTGSLSSHTTSSGSSVPVDVWNVVRELETRMRNEMESRLSQMAAEYRAEMDKLRGELRAALAQTSRGL